MQGNPDLVSDLYEELRNSAARLVRRHEGSVAPSSLVHEVLMRLWRMDPERWQSEAHFRAVAARAMRQVLVDRARSRNAAKRGGRLQRVDVSELPWEEGTLDLVALDHALQRLAEDRPRCARVVELRLLGGMEVPEVATWLEISPSTVKREWRVGRAYLISELQLQA
ncbi:MAG: sigma-70 family RNA polymerase sigma factor [Alphaproteobacteria bacterium]|nr:sigma-70 family RNA polymerase sigma factor [Alphaproteobacteria bacterium]MCB9693773.1 sigma-70 family RNA polymerase sigma factor [Alphaproteobacteria bacterium]